METVASRSRHKCTRTSGRSFANRHADPRENNDSTWKGDSQESRKNWEPDAASIAKGKENATRSVGFDFEFELENPRTGRLFSVSFEFSYATNRENSLTDYSLLDATFISIDFPLRGPPETPAALNSPSIRNCIQAEADALPLIRVFPRPLETADGDLIRVIRHNWRRDEPT